jgi:hypothetical protein
MRTGWDADARFLFFDCAPWRGGHSHQDRLQSPVHILNLRRSSDNRVPSHELTCLSEIMIC